MIDALQRQNINVLRNSSTVIEVDGHALRLVGLGDLWADDFHPAKAFARVSDNETVIALSHNPQSIEHLTGFSCNAVMAGHTHGIQTQFSVSQGKPTFDRHDYHAGMYNIANKNYT